MDHTEWLSSVSTIQFTVEKFAFKSLATTDRKCFCGTTTKLDTKFLTGQLMLENLADELNVSKIKYLKIKFFFNTCFNV